MPRQKTAPRRVWIPLLFLACALGGSLAVVAARPGWSPWVALVDGLLVGTVLGATGLVRSYDESWDEFWEATTLTYLLGILALVVYFFRRECPSAFFLVECAAGTVSYLMLLFVPPLTWLAADLLMFVGTFAGWFFSGLFRPEYY
jgi:hypothetical protein